MTEKEKIEYISLGKNAANLMKNEISEYLKEEISDKDLEMVSFAIGLFTTRVTEY